MKRKIINKFILLFIIINLLFITILPLKSKAIDDLTFTFDDNILFDSDISEYDDSFNLRNQQEYTEIYNATYSFTNDIIGSNPIGWIVDEGGGNVDIVSSLEGHSKIVILNDIDNSNDVRITQFFIPQITGIIELWIYYSDVFNTQSLLIRSESSTNINIRINNNKIQYFYSGSWNDATNGGISINTWYHYRLDFNSTLDTFDFYLNTVLLDNNIPFEINTTNINNIQLRTSNSPINYFYIDAIGYSFDVIENFDFENDIIGNEPLLWNINPHGGSSIATVERFQESNVLKVLDNDIVNNIHVVSDLNQSIDQSIEYYIAVNDTSLTDWYYMRFKESGSGRVLLRIDNNDLDYHDGAIWSSVKDDFIVANIWFKITINLHDSVNTFDIFIDDILEGSNLGFITNSIVSINQLSFESGATETSITYLDNFNINSTNFINYNYTTGQNLFPYIDISETLQEVDKYEFALGSINTLQTIGSSSYGTWTESDNGGHNTVHIKEHPTDSNNRVVEIDTYNQGDFKSLRKTNFSLIGNFVNIVIEFEITIAMSGNTSYYLFTIQSSSITTITQFIIWQNGSLGFIPYIGSGGVGLRDDLDYNIVYTLDVLLNYELDLFFMDWYIDGIYSQTYIKPLIVENKFGLREIHISSFWVDNEARMELYSVGVYDSGVSDSKEIGWSLIDLEVSDWNPHTYNLFNILGNGVMTLGIISGNYSVGENFVGFVNPFNLTNELLILNFYELTFFNLSNPSIVFSISGKDFSNSHLKIDGVKLLQGSNEYSLIFESTGIDINEGYFYVIGSKLFFYHISDDSNLEFIQARFNINDISSEGFLTSFRSSIDNNAKGFFRVNFTTTSNIIQFPIIETTTRFILTQNRTIRDLVILITDNDINSITGLTEGFIHLIKLQQVENLLISVITTSLIAMMIPILIILVPTLGISQAYGKNLIIPMFIFISLILTTTGIIPIWLFFIIAISNSVFIIKKKERLI